MTDQETQRFWTYVDRLPSGCWEWRGSRTSYGYGQFRYGSQTDGTRAQPMTHRLSWQLAHGPIPKGGWVLHRCDNPPCVNPAHLFLGSAKDNTRDRREKGRGIHQPPRMVGEDNPRAKLTREDVLAIRADTDSTISALSRAYGVHRTAIRYAKIGKTWRDI